MKALIWLSGCAPMKPSAGWPLTKAITAGIDWMPIWPGICGMVVDVHLDQLDLALGRADRLFDDRRQLTAGPAPGRPEVDQHRLALRFLDDVLHEGLGGRLLDQIKGIACGTAAPPCSIMVTVSSPDVSRRCWMGLAGCFLARLGIKFSSARWRFGRKIQSVVEPVAFAVVWAAEAPNWWPIGAGATRFALGPTSKSGSGFPGLAQASRIWPVSALFRPEILLIC